MPEAGEVAGLEKTVDTSYGKTTAHVREMDRMLETSQEQIASGMTPFSGCIY